ncbi:Hsp70 family protein [Caenimonas aquaedulcis]|uniref:Hsp70 family protein n=1 Tax=Caenimonas aquaedulcis TaxID=2793270 RepID=A0A931MG97_9BURK|nr:Hsp70 family protein [Caenimonas aquaedulcis]MBG9387873.1 Hsp70 family protein [Caenimonas aquaedulcis]
MPGAARGTLGVDFGTSNSAMAFVGPDGLARPVPLEGDEPTLPTAVFFNAEERSIHFGREAIALYLTGVDGRLMRSLKSLLGSSLLEEQTRVPEGMVSFRDVIARFLREMRARACQRLGHDVRKAVLGRPVHFVDEDRERDKRAQQALTQAAHAAGFEEVSLELEPIAAAFDYERRVTRETVVLIVDIGGGTSDFTVVRLGPDRAMRRERKGDVLATTGVHIGGTDYDRKLSLERVMPLLGYRHAGPTGREVPSSVFFDLSTWHLINWLYTPRVMRQVEDLRVDYRDKTLHDRLTRVLQDRLGHQLASEVEQAKIRTSMSDAPTAIDLSCIEPGLASPLAAAQTAHDLADLLKNVADCGHECLRRAGLQPSQLGGLYLTGGSSALRPFQDLLRREFPGAQLIVGDLFGGVASGLAYAGAIR